jgi:predicted TPR repeat methyltransferase
VSANLVNPRGLKALDLGAGNGLMGEQLSDLGAKRIVGVDIIRQAADAAERDRPGVYEQYFVCDMAKLKRLEHAAMVAADLNCLTCVAALGFGDIPTEAFVEAYNLIAPGGWVAFNLKEDFLTDAKSPFANLIVQMRDERAMSVRAEQRYRHRLATSGEPIFYVAVIARKARDFQP